MIEKIRNIVIEDFDLAEVKPIEGKINEIKMIKNNVDSLTKALETLKTSGAKSIISLKQNEALIRIPAEEFINISDGGEPRIKNTHAGKLGVMHIGDALIHAFLNEDQAEELVAKRHPFSFWYSDVVAKNLGEFYNSLEKVPEESLRHHLKSGDFSKWLFAIGEEEISKEFEKIEKTAKFSRNTREVLKRELMVHVEREIKKRLNV